jgi:hypothetical protein
MAQNKSGEEGGEEGQLKFEAILKIYPIHRFEV